MSNWKTDTAIRAAICAAGDEFGFSADELTGPSRHKSLCRARFAAQLVSSKWGASFTSMAHWFNRDHTTVKSGCDQARRFIVTDPVFKLRFERVQEVVEDAVERHRLSYLPQFFRHGSFSSSFVKGRELSRMTVTAYSTPATPSCLPDNGRTIIEEDDPLKAMMADAAVCNNAMKDPSRPREYIQSDTEKQPDSRAAEMNERRAMDVIRALKDGDKSVIDVAAFLDCSVSRARSGMQDLMALGLVDRKNVEMGGRAKKRIYVYSLVKEGDDVA